MHASKRRGVGPDPSPIRAQGARAVGADEKAARGGAANRVARLARRLLVSKLMEPTIESFMTPTPHSIGPKQTLQVAHDLMRNHGIRHLPVLEGGRLVGILSERDLHLVETLRDVDPQEVTVDEAMTLDPYSVGPRAFVRQVASEMAERKHGSAVVMKDGRVVGIFTTIDALRALAHLPKTIDRR